MATIKNFTNISQSKTLSEILPIETADAIYPWRELMKDYDSVYVPEDMSDIGEDDIPCWSLAALLNVLPQGRTLRHDIGRDSYKCLCKTMCTRFYYNPVDACVEMVIKLHELKML